MNKYFNLISALVLFGIVFICLPTAYFYMKKIRKTAIGTNEKLSNYEKLIVWLFALTSPVWSGAIFYFGWKDISPKKAEESNIISILSLAILLGVMALKHGKEVLFYFFTGGLFFVSIFNIVLDFLRF